MVELLSITPNYMKVLSLACGQPYGNKVGEKGIQSIIRMGHLSVLEHCYASFLVKCSVRVLGQLTRHRHLSFTVKSARGSQYNTFIHPGGLGQDKELLPYKEALDKGYTLEEAAYFLPQGVQTSLVVSGNFRAWFEYLPKRLCKRAMPEHREIARDIRDILKLNAPEIFKGSFMNCNNCLERSCSF